MKSGTHKFTSPRAMEVFEQIEKVLHERGRANTWDLALITGLSTNRMGEFLREMRRNGTAVCIERAKACQGGKVHAQWGPGESSAEIDEATDDAPRRITVRKQWAPHHVRDALVCCLFGAPAALAGA